MIRLAFTTIEVFTAGKEIHHIKTNYKCNLEQMKIALIALPNERRQVQLNH